MDEKQNDEGLFDTENLADSSESEDTSTTANEAPTGKTPCVL